MFKIIYLDDDINFSQLIKQNLEIELSCQVFYINDFTNFSSQISNFSSIDLIIYKETDKAPSAQEVRLIVEKINLKPMYIFYSNERPEQSSKVSHYPKNEFAPVHIINKTMEILDPESENRKAQIPDYIPFPIHYFFNISSFESDIFIKLNKKGGEQYVKRINANDEFDKESLKKYMDSGLLNLYIPKEFRFKFINKAVTETIESIKKVNKDESSTISSIIEIGDDSYKLSHDLLINLGISKESISLAEASIKNLKNSLKGNKSIAPLLQHILKDELSYSYKRCHLISLFSIEVLKRLDWFSKDQLKENFDKMVFVSFIHDIILVDEKLLKIHSKLDLYKSDLDEKEKEQVLNHANMASSLVQKYPNAPANTDIIIKQHHGTTNGIGFSENLNTGLFKLSIAFIVIEKFVIRLLEYDKEKETMKNIFDDLNEEFSLPTYKKVTDALMNTILKVVKSK